MKFLTIMVVAAFILSAASFAIVVFENYESKLPNATLGGPLSPKPLNKQDIAQTLGGTWTTVPSSSSLLNTSNSGGIGSPLGMLPGSIASDNYSNGNAYVQSAVMAFVSDDYAVNYMSQMDTLLALVGGLQNGSSPQSGVFQGIPFIWGNLNNVNGVIGQSGHFVIVIYGTGLTNEHSAEILLSMAVNS